jgi:hypothetical protein
VDGSNAKIGMGEGVKGGGGGRTLSCNVVFELCSMRRS